MLKALCLLVLLSATWLQATLSSKVVKKVVYKDSVNELLDCMFSRRLILPDYVYRKEGAQHDKNSSQSADLLVSTRKLLWDDAITKQQRKRKQTLLNRDRESIDFFKERLAVLLEQGRYDEAQRVEEDMVALEQEVSDLEAALLDDMPRPSRAPPTGSAPPSAR